MTSTGTTDPDRQPRPTPKSALGCVVASVAAIGGLVLLLVAGTFVLRMARAQREVVRRGATAPGTAQLRAIGCDPGSAIMDPRQSSWQESAGPATGTGAFIVCLATEGHAIPSCNDVARAYVEALRPTEKFVAQVRVPSRLSIECQTVYGETGAPLGNLVP